MPVSVDGHLGIWAVPTRGCPEQGCRTRGMLLVHPGVQLLDHVVILFDFFGLSCREPSYYLDCLNT